jgi:tellurite resistance protein TerC
LAIESADIIFAIDSIPAIFAITSDPFIVYTSNIFALLGLRALYFAISGFMNRFYFLHYGFASIIIILAIKMLLSDIYHIPILLSLATIIFILFVCIIISLLRPRKTDLKFFFERIEHLGLVSFRRLLMLENIVDLSHLNVSNAMQSRSETKVIRLNTPWSENKKIITQTHFSRYPLVGQNENQITGILHIQNLLFLTDKEISEEKLKSLCRPYFEMKKDLLLEEALRQFQRNYEQMAIVVNSNREWVGIICIEDILEEIVGRIGDEFDRERSGEFYSLADALSPGRIILDLEAKSVSGIIVNLINRIPGKELFSIKREIIIQALSHCNTTRQIYIGGGLAVFRGRIKGINKPLLAFARMEEGVSVEGTYEHIDMLFLLLTPRGMARMQPYLLADIVDLKESDYVMDRLQKTNSPEEIIEVIRAGQQIAID